MILRKANNRSGRALSALQSNTWPSRSESSTVEELHTRASLGLGTLEAAVMESLWKMGEANVSGVVSSLDRRLAYTTVMTTLSRLYRKGLLVRRMIRRAFFTHLRLRPRNGIANEPAISWPPSPLHNASCRPSLMQFGIVTSPCWVFWKRRSGSSGPTRPDKADACPDNVPLVWASLLAVKLSRVSQCLNPVNRLPSSWSTTPTA